MSKAHPRHSSPRPSSAAAAPLWDRIPHKAIIFAFILAAIPFCFGKYIEFHTPGAFDSGAFMYSAHRVLNGAIPGQDEAMTAKLGTLMANMLGISLFGYNDHAAKMIQMLLQFAALAALFVAMRRVFGTMAAGVSLVVASFYLSAPVIAKYGNVKEQYAIAFMVLGISMLLMRQLGGKWYWGLLAGAFLAWGPMFKETGTSALIAAVLFLFAQPLLKNRSWKMVSADVGLMLLGGFLAILPVQIWLSSIGAPAALNPYSMLSRYVLFKTAGLIHRNVPQTSHAPAVVQDSNKPAPAAAPKSSSYVEASRKFTTLKEQSSRIFRWYTVLILPISIALGAIILRLVRALMSFLRKRPAEPWEHMVLLLGLWWLIDMAFVWISPRPWEEYFLPLCASGAMTGGYLVAVYCVRLRAAADKALWIWLGIAVLVCIIVMAWPIAFGLKTAPFSGERYSSPSNGYMQRYAELGGTAPWEEVAHYVKEHSDPQDKIYVWGWFPGIYVEAQRDSASKMLPFTSEAHVVGPDMLADQARDLVKSFELTRPRFLVDTRKNDTPFIYPPLEFWPYDPRSGFVPDNPAAVASYEAWWQRVLRDEITSSLTESRGAAEAAQMAEDEVRRFNAMKPLRDYVMANYHVVSPETYRPIRSISIMAGRFGIHVLLERNSSAK